jgi:hypothetical protein
VSARARVRVVADDGGAREALVDAAVDAREGRCDVVDGPVQVVDARLQRDGEVDEIVLAAAEQHRLRGAHPPHAAPEDGDERQRDDSGGTGAERDPGRHRGEHGTPARDRATAG